tara:strand:- start:532 stop:693 length:162 start_codon:yes stop_codon:yes gene_type:complete
VHEAALRAGVAWWRSSTLVEEEESVARTVRERDRAVTLGANQDSIERERPGGA